MTITFCPGASKGEVIEILLSSAPERTLASVQRSNTLWAVKQGSGDPYIVCYLLASAVNLDEGSDPTTRSNTPRVIPKGWGYTSLREGPTMPCNCPIELLLLAPAADPQWRRKVREFHMRYTKSPVVGEIWALKRSKIPHVTISAVTPRLEGTYGGRTHPLTLGRLRMPLAQALSPRVRLPTSTSSNQPPRKKR